jgi:hypothetical protein
MERRPKELEPVTDLPSLNAETWDGRCSWQSGLEAPSITFGRRNCSHMTDGPFIKDGESRQGNPLPDLVLVLGLVSWLCLPVTRI